MTYKDKYQFGGLLNEKGFGGVDSLGWKFYF